MGFARCGQIWALCIKYQPRHEVSYRGLAEDTCSLIFECIEGPTVLPWQRPIDTNLKALKSILLSATEPSIYDELAVNAISVKMLYAMLMTFILIYDMRAEKWWVLSLFFYLFNNLC